MESESEEQFQLLVGEVMDCALFRLDAEGIVLSWNAGAQRIKGYRPEEIIGRSFTRFYTPEALASGEPYEHLRCAEAEGHAEFEGWRVRKDGTQFWAEVKLTALRGEAGRLRGFSKMTRDLTARKLAETAMIQSQRRLNEAQRIAHLGDWEWNIQSGELQWSDEVYRLFGLQPQEIKVDFESSMKRVHPEDDGLLRSSIAKTLEAKTPAGVEFRIQRSSGEIRTVFAQWELMADAAGAPLRMIGTLLDITDRKRTEDELRDAKSAAEAASLAKSEFLAKMSHEIRTPMNGILGMTELLLLEDHLPRQHRECLDVVKFSADSLLQILNDILDFSKIEAGKLDLQLRVYNIRQCIHDTLNMLKTEAAEKKLVLKASVAEDVPRMIEGDPGRVGQVLLNLISNGLKFTEHGSVLVQVAAVLDGDARMLEFSVKDTGIGILPEHHRVIFDAFIQADNSTTRRFGGTGLGLAICSQLVGLMGGRIWIESAENRGSTFRFTVPLVEAAPPGLVAS